MNTTLLDNDVVFQKKWTDDEIVIATSIAPVGIAKQKAAIDTWLEAGFHVVSLNIQDEIDKLKPIFKEVNFYQVNRDGRKKFGKPFVYVNDVLNFLQEYGSAICGIVNSDIQLRIEDNFIPFILEQARDSFVFASRMDIDSEEDEMGEVYAYGFDMYFFDRTIIRQFPECDDFCLGVPWWDYWVIAIALQHKLNPKYIQNTMAFHIKHDMNYSLDTWRKVGITFSKFYDPPKVESLQEMLINEEIEDFDKLIGPVISYSFILDVNQKSQLLRYPTTLNNLPIDNNFDLEQHLARGARMMAKAERARASFALGNEQKKQGKLDESIESYLQAIKLKPDYVRALKELGEVYELQENWSEAIDTYHRTIELAPENATIHLRLARALAKEEQNYEAIACYQKALELEGELPANAYKEIGDALLNPPEPSEKAIAAYQKAAELKSQWPYQLYMKLGDLLQEAEEFERSIVYYQQAIQANPNVGKIYVAIAKSYTELGEINKAIKCYRKAIELNPKMMVSYRNLGNLLCQKQRFDAAIKCYEELLEIEPDYYPIYRYIGDAWLQKGEDTKACECYRKALEITAL
jgi:tetratricopeptide (TPR) repeat protein